MVSIQRPPLATVVPATFGEKKASPGLESPHTGIRYEVLGDDLQALRVHLPESGEVLARPGGLVSKDPHVALDTRLKGQAGENDNLLTGFTEGLKRFFAGDSIWVTSMKAAEKPGKVVLASSAPGKVLPLDLAETGEILCRSHTFLCADPSVKTDPVFVKNLGAGILGGLLGGGAGPILEKLSGKGMAYLHATGSLVAVDLKPGQAMDVDLQSLVAMTGNVDYDIRLTPGLKNLVFGGEGLFLAHVTGPGKIYIQTHPIQRLAGNLQHADAGANPFKILTSVLG